MLKIDNFLGASKRSRKKGCGVRKIAIGIETRKSLRVKLTML
jgi:hypothetical protein